MPSKTDKIAIDNPSLDRRVKLTPEDKLGIKKEYEQGLISISGLARKWNVSKRSIQFILFPERAEHAKKLYAERRKDKRYYDKDKHKEYTKKHRNYKKELYEKGALQIEPDNKNTLIQK